MMKITIEWTKAITLVLVCVFAGQWLARDVLQNIGIYMPSPLIGLLLLFGGLVLLGAGNTPTALHNVSQFLLKHMSLFFVPATLSVILYWSEISSHLVVLIAIVVSTFIGMLCTLYTFKWLTGKAAIDPSDRN
ncbi:CidA/LrgA family protein [Aestuariibacter sp. AA17]|uniref:CidA/LrgA family protein n=1 Tax=Fluctibacter corallii TaxID=2984329 RepID=A0ABT3A804_9ALTE|nr:CidA/LrgA family protein [Aestuariibacter sp. AA17]MCV2884801.1 CidA/LrgA family protein [Aestuariibacter sp. AA17]